MCQNDKLQSFLTNIYYACYRANCETVRTSKVETVKGSVADPDPGSGVFMTPGYGMGKNQDPDLRDEQPGSYFRELKKQFLG